MYHLLTDNCQEIIVAGGPWGWMIPAVAVKGARPKVWQPVDNPVKFDSFEDLVKKARVHVGIPATVLTTGPGMDKEYPGTVVLSNGTQAAIINVRFYNAFHRCAFWVEDAYSAVRVVRDGTIGLIMPMSNTELSLRGYVIPGLDAGLLKARTPHTPLATF